MRVAGFTTLLVLVIPLATSFDMKCTSKTGGLWTFFIGKINYCDVQSLNITSPNETITSINGEMTPTTFEALNVLAQTVHYLPKGLGKFFPKLRGLEIFNSGLKTIQAADLEGLNNLESLFISNNLIEELPSDLFNFTPKIKDIYFYSNQISRVGRDLLKNLHSFKRIDFSLNKCIDNQTKSHFEAFKEELKTKCPHLEEEIEIEITTLTPKTAKEVELEKAIEKLEAEKSSMALAIERLTAEIESLKRTCYNGLPDSTTKLLHTKSTELNEGRAGGTVNESVEDE